MTTIFADRVSLDRTPVAGLPSRYWVALALYVIFVATFALVLFEIVPRKLLPWPRQWVAAALGGFRLLLALGFGWIGGWEGETVWDLGSSLGWFAAAAWLLFEDRSNKT